MFVCFGSRNGSRLDGDIRILAAPESYLIPERTPLPMPARHGIAGAVPRDFYVGSDDQKKNTPSVPNGGKGRPHAVTW